tara:strand:+ start:2180 stop:2722 length:543 start_codon:yes stop_codon:yes gene_type:complete
MKTAIIAAAIAVTATASSAGVETTKLAQSGDWLTTFNSSDEHDIQACMMTGIGTDDDLIYFIAKQAFGERSLNIDFTIHKVDAGDGVAVINADLIVDGDKWTLRDAEWLKEGTDVLGIEFEWDGSTGDVSRMISNMAAGNTMVLLNPANNGNMTVWNLDGMAEAKEAWDYCMGKMGDFAA